MAAHASAPDRLTRCQVPLGQRHLHSRGPCACGRRVCTLLKELLRRGHCPARVKSAAHPARRLSEVQVRVTRVRLHSI